MNTIPIRKYLKYAIYKLILIFIKIHNTSLKAIFIN